MIVSSHAYDKSLPVVADGGLRRIIAPGIGSFRSRSIYGSAIRRQSQTVIELEVGVINKVDRLLQGNSCH